MNLKQAQAVLSDLLMKCEQENVALPTDPLETIAEALQALKRDLKHEIKRSQLDDALEHMKDKYGLTSGAALAPPHAEEKKRKHTSAGLTGQKSQYQQRYMRAPTAAAAPSGSTAHAASTHSPAKKSRLKDDVRATPAVRVENQMLVDQLVELGEYELKTRRSQRGVTRFRAAKQIRDASDVIRSGAQARRLEGVGQSAAEKIDVLLNGGLHNLLKEYEAEDNDVGDDEVEGAANKRARRGPGAEGGDDNGREKNEKGKKMSASGDNDDEADDDDDDDEFYSATE